jgi:hypothetical protein
MLMRTTTAASFAFRLILASSEWVFHKSFDSLLDAFVNAIQIWFCSIDLQSLFVIASWEEISAGSVSPRLQNLGMKDQNQDPISAIFPMSP